MKKWFLREKTMEMAVRVLILTLLCQIHIVGRQSSETDTHHWAAREQIFFSSCSQSPLRSQRRKIALLSWHTTPGFILRQDAVIEFLPFSSLQSRTNFGLISKHKSNKLLRRLKQQHCRLWLDRGRVFLIKVIFCSFRQTSVTSIVAGSLRTNSSNQSSFSRVH